MNRIKCLFKGHDLKTAQYRNAYPSLVPPSIARHFDGSVKITHSWICGFFHGGLYSVCERCGSQVSVDANTDLLIVVPEFMGVTQTNMAASNRRLELHKNF